MLNIFLKLYIIKNIYNININYLKINSKLLLKKKIFINFYYINNKNFHICCIFKKNCLAAYDLKIFQLIFGDDFLNKEYMYNPLFINVYYSHDKGTAYSNIAYSTEVSIDFVFLHEKTINFFNKNILCTISDRLDIVNIYSIKLNEIIDFKNLEWISYFLKHFIYILFECYINYDLTKLEIETLYKIFKEKNLKIRDNIETKQQVITDLWIVFDIVRKKKKKIQLIHEYKILLFLRKNIINFTNFCKIFFNLDLQININLLRDIWKYFSSSKIFFNKLNARIFLFNYSGLYLLIIITLFGEVYFCKHCLQIFKESSNIVVSFRIHFVKMFYIYRNIGRRKEFFIKRNVKRQRMWVKRRTKNFPEKVLSIVRIKYQTFVKHRKEWRKMITVDKENLYTDKKIRIPINFRKIAVYKGRWKIYRRRVKYWINKFVIRPSIDYYQKHAVYIPPIKGYKNFLNFLNVNVRENQAWPRVDGISRYKFYKNFYKNLRKLKKDERLWKCFYIFF